MTPLSVAFTIVEILVSLTILALMVVFMGQALNQTSRLWSMGQANTDRAQNIRAVNEAIASELRTALLPLDRTTQAGFQFVVNPPAITSQMFNHPNSAFWQGPSATDPYQGEAAEVGYFVQWDTVTNPQNPRAALCRFLVNPGSAAGADANYQIYSAPANWLSDDILHAVAPATVTQSYQGLFAENVVALWVRCLDSAGQPITKTFTGEAYTDNVYDSRMGYTDSVGTKSESYKDPTGHDLPLCALPPVVEVSLVMLDADTAARVTPGLRSSIEDSLAQFAANPQSRNGTDFVQAARQSSSGLHSIAAGLHAAETRIFLQGSR